MGREIRDQDIDPLVWFKEEDGCIGYKILPDGRSISAWYLHVGLYHLCLSSKFTYGFYDNVYSYKSYPLVIKWLNKWDGIEEPNEWFRNPQTGRRRPEGDATREYLE